LEKKKKIKSELDNSKLLKRGLKKPSKRLKVKRYETEQTNPQQKEKGTHDF
jgi:ribosomal protein L31E